MPQRNATETKKIAPDSIAVRNEPYKHADEMLLKARTLMGGTEAMRKQPKYLPQFEGESDQAYGLRKSMSFLFNGFRKTVWDLTDRVFEKPTTLTETTNAEFLEWAEDVDLEGRDLSTFANDILREGLVSGIEFLFVDSPPSLAGETIAQAKAAGNRPYIVHIRPEKVLGWKFSRIANRYILTQFRYKENVPVDGDEFSQETTEQIKVIDLPPEGKVRIRNFQKSDEGWAQHGEDQITGLDEITITPFYANRKDRFKGSPPLEDLSDLNIAHWQSQSDQRNILHFARVPILFASGVPIDTELKISAASLTKAAAPEADMKFVEHSGNAIASGQKDLEHLEFFMQTLGLQFIVSGSTAQTATGENRNDRKETSRLSSTADNLASAFQQCFIWMAMHDGKQFDGIVDVFRDFGAGAMSEKALNVLIQSVMNGKLSRKSFWQEMVRHGLLPEGFDPEKEEEELIREAPEVDGMTGFEDLDSERDE